MFGYGGIVKSSCQIGLCNRIVPHFFVFIFVVCKSVYYVVINIPVDKFFEKKVYANKGIITDLKIVVSETP